MISVVPSSRMPSRSATRIDGAFSGWIMLMTCDWASSPTPREGRAGRLGGVAVPPEARRRVQPISMPGPAFGPPAADAADEHAAGPLLHGPEAEPAEPPVAEDHRHVPPRFRAGHRPAPRYFITSGSAHIAAYPCQVGLAEHPQPESLGLQILHGNSFRLVAIEDGAGFGRSSNSSTVEPLREDAEQ